MTTTPNTYNPRAIVADEIIDGIRYVTYADGDSFAYAPTDPRPEDLTAEYATATGCAWDEVDA